MASPVRFLAGVTNAAQYQALAELGMPDPFFYHFDFQDFDAQALADWTVTKVGAGTNVVTAEDGGVLLLTTAAGATDSVLYQRVAAAFLFVPATALVAGKKTFFRMRVKASDANTSAITGGLINTTTTPLTATDGVQFIKATGATSFILRSSIGGVNTDLAIPTAAPNVFANATYIELAWYFDGKLTVYAFVNPGTGQGVSGNRGPVASFQPTLTTAVLNHSFGITNGAAAAKTLSVDFSMAARER